MAKTAIIRLDTDKYRKPTQEDMRKAKEYVLKRDDTADNAWELASEYIMAAVEQIVRVAYKYNIPPEKFSFDSSVNKQMMEEITNIMDELDEDLYELLQVEATSCTKDKDDKLWLIALLLTLGHRNMGLRDTMYAYEWRMLQQIGALIAGALYGKLPLSVAIVNIKQYINKVNQNPQFIQVSKYKELFANPYINNGGKPTFPDGSSNVRGVPTDGFNALKMLFGNAIAHVWMKNQLHEWSQNDKIAGYYQLRGSDYPCNVCDNETGFHKGADPDEEPYPHVNCRCYRIPVYFNN